MQAREELLKLEDSVELYNRVGDTVKLRELYEELLKVVIFSMIDSVRKRRQTALTPPPKEECVDFSITFMFHFYTPLGR